MKTVTNRKKQVNRKESKAALASQAPASSARKTVSLKRYYDGGEPNWIKASELEGVPFAIISGYLSKDQDKIFFKIEVDKEIRTVSFAVTESRLAILEQAKEAQRKQVAIYPVTVEVKPLSNNRKFFDIVPANDEAVNEEDIPF